MNTTLAALDNEALLAATNSLVAISNTTEVDLLLHLGEVDRRRLYAEGFSKYAAFDRICVARLGRRHPSLLRHLAAGRLNLTSLRILSCVLSKEDCSAARAEEIAAQAFGLSTEDVAELAVALDPKPLLPDSARKLPSPPASPPPPPLELPLASPPSPVVAAPPPPSAPVAIAPEPTRPPSAPPAPELKVEAKPLAPDAYGIRFTADKETYELLKELQALLSHRKDKRDFGSIIKQALTHELAAVKKERFGIGAKPKKKTAARPARKVTRHVPVDTVRAVVEREGLTCGFVSADGRRCGERAFLQVEHLDGFARTGVHEQERLALRCAAHNLLSAERMYGRDKMEVMRGGTRFKTEGSPHFSSS